MVELAAETSSYVKSSHGGLYAIAVINSFVIIPVGSERVVAVVTALDMAEEQEAGFRNRQMLVIAKPRRTMWVSMIGTLTQTPRGKVFEYGVRRYPELDNPVWFASEEDLDVIFDKGSITQGSKVVIGKSPIFTDYDVAIDIDRFFGKHAAILGNTGSGKSCTVTALVKAVLDRGMPNAHFIIFDTNNEYEHAFTTPEGEKLYDRVVLRNDENAPSGLFIPHWFMNSQDYHAFFRPGEGAQAPLLFSAISAARSAGKGKGARFHVLTTLRDAAMQLEAFLSEPPGKGAYYRRQNLRDRYIDPLLAVLAKRETAFSDVGMTDSWNIYVNCCQQILTTAQGEGTIDPAMTDVIREQLTVIHGRLAADEILMRDDPESPAGVDAPAHFDFDEFVTTVFAEVLDREAVRNPALRNYVGTLQLRLEQARQDPRYSFLFRVPEFTAALASFLRLLFGTAPATNFETAPPPWRDYYDRQFETPATTHKVTILDLSQLASEVLENVTALLGRLVLEFMQRLPERAQFPVVLLLEEAHHYIPAEARLERQQRAREVFERIAKEGRKFGLSLVVASQRPSELSRTVLAQCNSFVVHRIQNPDDQDYFRSVVSGVNRELLDQLPALAQQHAIVLGDCVTLPLQVRLNTVDPRPRSDDPKFSEAWSKPEPNLPDFEQIAALWEGAAQPPPTKTSAKAPKK